MRKLLLSGLSGWFVLNLIAVPAFAHNFSVDASADVKVSHENVKPDLPCMQNAVDTRDAAVIAAVQAYTNSWISALTKRRSDLKAAWGIVDRTERRQAIEKAWKAFRESMKTARSTLRTSRNTAWEQFRKSAKACKGSSDDKVHADVEIDG